MAATGIEIDGWQPNWKTLPVNWDPITKQNRMAHKCRLALLAWYSISDVQAADAGYSLCTSAYVTLQPAFPPTSCPLSFSYQLHWTIPRRISPTATGPYLAISHPLTCCCQLCWTIPCHITPADLLLSTPLYHTLPVSHPLTCCCQLQWIIPRCITPTDLLLSAPLDHTAKFGSLPVYWLCN